MDLINRQELMKKIRCSKNGDCEHCDFFTDGDTWCDGEIFGTTIMKMPAIEPKRGEWIEYKDEFTHCHQCSICGGDAMGEGDENGMFFEVLTDICPHCGASMRGEKHETRADE